MDFLHLVFWLLLRMVHQCIHDPVHKCLSSRTLSTFVDAIFDVLKKVDLSQKISSIITSHTTSAEIVSNALILIMKLSSSGMHGY